MPFNHSTHPFLLLLLLSFLLQERASERMDSRQRRCAPPWIPPSRRGTTPVECTCFKYIAIGSEWAASVFVMVFVVVWGKGWGKKGGENLTQESGRLTAHILLYRQTIIGRTTGTKNHGYCLQCTLYVVIEVSMEPADQSLPTRRNLQGSRKYINHDDGVFSEGGLLLLA
jgi:hypothetical protein